MFLFENTFLIFVFIYFFQSSKDENIQALCNVDAFTCAVGVDDYTMYSKSSTLQVMTGF